MGEGKYCSYSVLEFKLKCLVFSKRRTHPAETILNLGREIKVEQIVFRKRSAYLYFNFRPINCVTNSPVRFLSNHHFFHNKLELCFRIFVVMLRFALFL